MSLGHDEVSQHVEGVAIWMHRHNPTVVLVDLQEPGIIEAHNRHLWPFAAAQADLLTTMHPVFIIERKNAVGPLVLKPVD